MDTNLKSTREFDIEIGHSSKIFTGCSLCHENFYCPSILVGHGSKKWPFVVPVCQRNKARWISKHDNASYLFDEGKALEESQLK